MARICAFSQEHPELTPSDALVKLFERMGDDHRRMQMAQAQGQHAFNPNLAQQQHLQQPPQSHFQTPNTFLSPAQAAHLNLPGTNASGSPATLSNQNTPAMPHLALQQHAQQHNVMGAPGPPSSAAMVHQASHQGTNPSAVGTPATGSANASPNVNVTGKRRRPSGVNVGAEDGMDGVNGIVPGGGGGGGGSGNGGGTLIGAGQKVKQSPRVGGKRQKGS